MIVENLLRNLGLTSNEIKVYLFLVSHGESIASIIAKRLEAKRTAVYAILESLEEKGMIVSFVKNDVKHFDAIEIEDIVELCSQKANEMNRLARSADSLKQEFKKIRSKGKIPTLEVRGKIKYYQGMDAVTDLVVETLDEPETEQLCFGHNTYYSDMPGNDWGNYVEKRLKKKMKVRSIQPNEPEGLEYQKRDKKELRRTYLVPTKEFGDDCEINIIGDMIAMFTTKGEEPMGMKMYNKQMAKAMRGLFELAWEKAGEYDKKKRGKPDFLNPAKVIQ
ncbi:MAG: helix-turn-helix domain-containing protein [bacterium]|nr:helix-turn-helix domain-containing protein [bacterium]